jgi:glutamine synthetase
MPGSLDEALTCLEEDHTFLTKGDVFSEELIETFVGYKRKAEAEAVRLRPHPYEFALYTTTSKPWVDSCPSTR